LVTVDQLERYFGRIRQPEINDLFKGYRTQQRQRRASSATWNSPMSDRKCGASQFIIKITFEYFQRPRVSDTFNTSSNRHHQDDPNLEWMVDASK